MKFKKQSKLVLVLLVFIVIFSLALQACSKDSNKGEPDLPTQAVTTNTPEPVKTAAPKEPVEITIAAPGDEEQFKNRFKKIDEKLEHINIKYVSYDGTSAGLQEKFAAGITPDIVESWYINTYSDLDIIEPFEEMARKNGFDLNSIAPSLLANLKAWDVEGRMVGLPDGTAYQALYYNKEIFDLFGVPYPDPNKPMTWDEVLDLTKKMTAVRDGKQYTGLEFTEAPFGELAVNVSDPTTGDVLLTKEPAIQTYFEYLKKLFAIPGFLTESKDIIWSFKQNLTAMTVTMNNYLGTDWGDFEGMKKNIEMAPVPVWADKPGVGPALGTTPMVINKFSKHKNEAFEVLAEYVSTENQVEISRTMATGPVTSDEAVLKQFGAEVPAYQGKNVAAFFLTTPANFEGSLSRWNGAVNMWDATNGFAKSDGDITKFLRQYSEGATGRVKDAMLAAQSSSKK